MGIDGDYNSKTYDDQDPTHSYSAPRTIMQCIWLDCSANISLQFITIATSISLPFIFMKAGMSIDAHDQNAYEKKRMTYNWVFLNVIKELNNFPTWIPTGWRQWGIVRGRRGGGGGGEERREGEGEGDG